MRTDQRPLRAPGQLGCATDRLASFVAGLRFGDLPDSVIERIGQCLLDAMGNAGSARWRDGSSAILVAAMDSTGMTGGSTVIGDPRRYHPHTAVLLNGALIHSADFDDTNEAGQTHPGAPVVPVALALAESAGSTGRDLLVALAAGYEVCCRVGAALGGGAYERGFHPTSVAGLFGGVAAGASLHHLEADVVAAGFGVASSMASGTMQFLSNGAWNKRLQPGLAARSAILALSIAEAGFPAVSQPLEGEHGILNAYSNTPDPNALIANLGCEWLSADTVIKPYPSCRFTHGAIDAAIALRQRISSGELAAGRVEVTVSPQAYDVAGQPRVNNVCPTNPVEAQFSLYFQTAIALLTGTVELSSLNLTDDTRIRRLCKRITVTPDSGMAAMGAHLRWIPDSGERPTEARCHEPLGSPSAPLLWPAVIRKFEGLMDGIVSDTSRNAMHTGARGLAELSSVSEWLTHLRGTWAVPASTPRIEEVPDANE